MRDASAPAATRNLTPFGEILKRAVQATPGAVGGAFADAEGEMIDAFTTRDPHDWALVTAHYDLDHVAKALDSGSDPASLRSIVAPS